MKKLIALCIVALQAGSLSARINFGSRDSAIEITGSGTVDFGSASLTRGTLRDRTSSAAFTGSGLTCDEVTVETKDGATYRSMTATGTVTLDGDVVLGNSDVLTVKGGTMPGTVKADGVDATPSVLRGSGSFTNDIQVNNDNTAGADKELQIEWDGELNVNVQLNGTDSNEAKLTLGSDLVFAPTKGITVSEDDKIDENIVVCNGHALVFNGNSTIAANDQISLDTPIIVNNGLFSIGDTVKIITGAMSFTGGKIAGAAGFNGNSLGGTFNNVHFTNFTENTLGSSSCTWTFNNCMLGESSNTEILEVKQGGLIGGNTDVFDGDSNWADNSIIRFNKDAALGGTLTAGSGMQIDGGGNTVTIGSSAAIDDGDNDISLTNVKLLIDGTSGLVTTDSGTQKWSANNVIIQNSAAPYTQITIKAGEFAAQSGTNANPLGAAMFWYYNDGPSVVELNSDLPMAGQWGAGISQLRIEGNGYDIDVASAGFYSPGDAIPLTLSNMTVKNIQATTFGTDDNIAAGGGSTVLNNVVLTGSNGTQTNSIRVTGELKQNNDTAVSSYYYADLYNIQESAEDAYVQWAGTPKIALEKDLYLTNNWTFTTGAEVNGQGYTIDLSDSEALLDIDGTFDLTNVTLKDVAAANIDTQGAATITMTDVKWYDSADGALHIHGAAAAGVGPASVTLSSADDAGNIFGSAGGNVVTQWGSNGVNMSLLDNCTLNYEWQFDGVSRIDGNGYRLTFEDSNSTIDLNAHLYLTNMTLGNMAADQIDADGSSDLRLAGVVWEDGAVAQKVRFSGYEEAYATVTLPTGAAKGEIFDASQTTAMDGRLELLTNIGAATNSPVWQFTTASQLVGNGHVFNATNRSLEIDGDLHISDLIITELGDATFKNAGGNDLFLSNVSIADAADNGMIRISASTVDAGAAQGAAQVTLASSDSDTNLFDTAVTFANGANIDLEKDTLLGSSAVWTFSQDAQINGHGNKFNLQNGQINIGTNTLHLKNMVIDGMTASAIADTAGTVTMSDVTIILSESLDLSALTYEIAISGPVTFVTGTKTFVAPSGGTNSSITGVTVWYDTLGSDVSARVSGFDLASSGRIAEVGSGTITTSLTFADGGTTEIAKSYDLSPNGSSANGIQVTFNGGTDFTFDGNGNTFYIADLTDASTKPVLTVDSDIVVKTTNITFDGFQEAAIDLNTYDSDYLNFDAGTVLRLQSDQALTTTYTFGRTATTSQPYSVTVDLNGHALDIGSATLLLQDDSNMNILFKNGRLTGVTGSGLGALSTTAHTNAATQTLTFEDIELSLAADTTLTSSKIVFKGNCSVTGGRPDANGDADRGLHFWHTPVTIDTGATLYVANGTKLGLNGADESTDASLTFAAHNSTLFLDGATLGLTTATNTDTYIFDTGTIKVDGIVNFDIGSGNTLELGNVGSGTNASIEVDLQPGASIVVSSGTLDYQDDENMANDD